jgi:tetratricopeptide (TPR) repeat protein
MKRLPSVLVVVALCSLAGAAMAGDPIMDSVDLVLSEPTRLVAEWDENGSISFMMVAAVICIGAVIAIVNLLPPNIAKAGAIVLGSAVSLLTGLANSYFDFDHRQYKTLVSQGRSLLIEAKIKRNQLLEFPPTDAKARNEKLEEIRRDAQTILALPTTLKSRPPIPGSFANDVAAKVGMLMSTAHAQSNPSPEWVTRLPVDDTNLYFLGYADGRDYTIAREAALQSAHEEAKSQLAARLEGIQRPGGVDGTAAAHYLIGSARVASTHSYFDKSRNVFRAYVLLALAKKAADLDLRLYATKNSVPISPVQQQALQAPAPTGDRYVASRVDLYAKEAEKSHAKMPAALYDQYLKARKLRYEGKPAEAIPLLNNVVKAQPDFYLGWYNLARAHDEEGHANDAKAAYERAIELERKAGLKDASLYNTYGFFLYRQKKFGDAIEPLKTALEIAPDHPTAARTLTAARAAAGKL